MGSVFDIQRFCIHDGPGLRTTVFFKGCPLRCRWCSNPESQAILPVLLYNQARCMGCGECVRCCITGAITVNDGGGIAIDRDRCQACRACESVCPKTAIHLKGQEMTVAEVMAEAVRDRAFYDRSGGGVTLSGGEPFLQPDFAVEMLAALEAEGIQTAVETTALAAWRVIEQALPYLNTVMVDAKHVDPEKHLSWTGVDNCLILDNIGRLLGAHPSVRVRIPVIPGFNDDDDSAAGFAGFFNRHGVPEVELLPYHSLGEGKYRMLGLPYPGDGIPQDASASVDRLRMGLEQAGIIVNVH